MKEPRVPVKQLKKEVSAISDGTVIDHIDSKGTFKVANILNIQNENDVVLIGMNLSSKQLGKKGIIKIGGRILTQSEANKIALIAPEATLNIIKDYKVDKKLTVSVPDIIEGIVKCFNPNCVSNHERIQSKFHTLNKTPLKLRCHYCERTMKAEDIELV
jgi:aspartate carbamoyltransferase regulatory subunit